MEPADVEASTPDAVFISDSPSSTVAVQKQWRKSLLIILTVFVLSGCVATLAVARTSTATRSEDADLDNEASATSKKSKRPTESLPRAWYTLNMNSTPLCSGPVKSNCRDGDALFMPVSSLLPLACHDVTSVWNITSCQTFGDFDLVADGNSIEAKSSGVFLFNARVSMWQSARFALRVGHRNVATCRRRVKMSWASCQITGWVELQPGDKLSVQIGELPGPVRAGDTHLAILRLGNA